MVVLRLYTHTYIYLYLILTLLLPLSFINLLEVIVQCAKQQNELTFRWFCFCFLIFLGPRLNHKTSGCPIAIVPFHCREQGSVETQESAFTLESLEV